MAWTVREGTLGVSTFLTDQQVAALNGRAPQAVVDVYGKVELSAPVAREPSGGPASGGSDRAALRERPRLAHQPVGDAEFLRVRQAPLLFGPARLVAKEPSQQVLRNAAGVCRHGQAASTPLEA